jgi:hypothetical protein
MSERTIAAGDESPAEQDKSGSEDQGGSEVDQNEPLPATKPRRNGPNALDLESAWDY